MKFKPVFLIPALSFCFEAAWADGVKLPPVKDGYWENHSSQIQQGKTVYDKSMKMCQSKDLTKSMKSLGEGIRKENECTTSLTQSSATTYVEESRCAKGPNAGAVTKVVYSYESDTASHTEMRMTSGKTETVMITDAKYLGDCPAGMKPGDLMMDGKIISGGQ